MVVWWVLSTSCSMALSQNLGDFLSIMCQSQALSQRSSCVPSSSCHDPPPAHRANEKIAAFRVLSKTLKLKNSQNFQGFMQFSLQGLLRVLATEIQTEMKLYIFSSVMGRTTTFPRKFMLKFLAMLKIGFLKCHLFLDCHSIHTSHHYILLETQFFCFHWWVKL